MENNTQAIIIAGTPSWPHVIFNRPEKANALNQAMLHIMAEHFQKWHDAPPVGITLMAHGHHFSSGADLHDMRASGQKSVEANLQDTKILADVLTWMDACPCPIITAAQGAIMGGAIGLLALSDFALLDASSYMAFNEINLGLMPAMIAPYVVRRIGQTKATLYFMSGQRILPDEAKNIGLCDRVTLDAKKDALQLERQLCMKPQKALHAIKKQMKMIDDKPVDMMQHAKMLAELRQTDTAQLLLQAFLQKQKK